MKRKFSFDSYIDAYICFSFILILTGMIYSEILDAFLWWGILSAIPLSIITHYLRKYFDIKFRRKK